MMVRERQQNWGNEIGMTLIEVVFVLLIGGIALTGLVVAFTDGIRQWNSTSEMMDLYNEGGQALALMERFTRNASLVKVHPSGGYQNARLELRYPGDVGRAEFYYVPADKSLRWNNLTQNNSKFNLTLLPFKDFPLDPGEEPYLRVKRIAFTPIDPEPPDNPIKEGYWLLKIELVLENPKGDTLYMSSVVAKRNASGS